MLAQLQAALQHPVFPLYLGRKVTLWRYACAATAGRSRADVPREAYRWYQDKFNTLKLTLPDCQNAVLVGR